jgi:hypothetical protein
MTKSRTLTSRATAIAAAAAIGTLMFIASPANGDDRDLFRASSDAPYLFILFDATGSMQWGLNNNSCPTRCDDDPDSRMFQAKSALDTVMTTLVAQNAGVNLGFATFPNQNGSYVYSKYNTFQGDYVNDRETGSNWCQGWEPNNDTSNDEYNGYTYKWPTSTINDGLELGDIVPLNWADDNIARIRQRLAPNLARGLAPDYGIATYFNNRRRSGQLGLLRADERPFLGRGNTPLEGALDDFESWYDNWVKDARRFDPQFALGCREVSVVLLTDGFETCGGQPTRSAASLMAKGIKTYVIGFAVNNPALDAIATAGGTDATPGPNGQPNPGDPGHEAYFAGDEQALVDAFLAIIGQVKLQSRTFATAAVPSVVGSAADEVFLTSFSPVEDGTSLWPGRVDAYVKPIPLTTNAFGQSVPDRNKTCVSPTDESCLAWDAAALLESQAPTAADVASDIYKVSNSVTDRRVYFARAFGTAIPLERAFFLPPSNAPDEVDLYGPTGMGLDPASPTFVTDGRDVIRYTLQKKSALILDPTSGGQKTVDFVLGDIFHSDPIILGEPSRFDYFSADLEGQTAACDATNDRRDRYPCFVRDHLYRRKILFLGSNEGQLHAFDAGKAQLDANALVEFTTGTGKEIFSFVPRSAMPKVRSMAEGNGQQFSVDGTSTIDDVLIDPQSSQTAPPSLNDREWRSVLVASMREGGRSYSALDVTQPDPIDSVTGLPIVTSQVPGCIDGGSGCGPIPFASVLWEFTDTWDEDADNPGAPDLGDTWSRVNMGRIRIIEGTQTVDRYVAIFGGGLDASFKEEPIDPITGLEKPYSGNYLYMVDVETGKAIYKRRLDIVNGVRKAASAPSEPAAVDLDQDGYIDTIYIGTTEGYLFKVDLSVKAVLERNVQVMDYSQNDPSTGSPPLRRFVDRIVDPAWDPFAIFWTERRPIYFPPSVIFASELASYALAFGSGDREDLWADDPRDGRFFVFLDTNLQSTDPTLPMAEDDLEWIDADASKAASPQGDLLANPDTASGKVPGWMLTLDPNERVIAKSFGLAGVVFFNTYIPDLTSSQAGVCGAAGSSNLYSVFATNGLGIRPSGERYTQVSDFTTRPFVEASGGIKKGGSGGSTPPPDECDSQTLAQMADSIKALMPSECKFANYRLNVMTLESSSGLECLVPVPVCVIERNWKEF